MEGDSCSYDLVRQRRILSCILLLLFGMMVICAILCMFVLLRVDEQATEDPRVQEVETAEQELVEGKLCP
jgi:beta-lactam-binding protein with PASTA domain